MDKFIWTKEYSVGIEEIDEQHRHFFEIANSIIDIMDRNPSKEDLFDLVKRMNNHALNHFTTEERYFDEFNYGDASEHIAEHNKYREKMLTFLNKLNDDKTDLRDLTLEAAAYSNAWLSTHILLIDKKYTKFFNEHGLK